MKIFASLTIAICLATGIYAQCRCGSNSYTSADVTGAVNKGYSVNPNPTTTTGAYPHIFGNRERILFNACPTGPYVEYPLKRGTPYTSGPPGADRVVYQKGAAKKFCGCMTHTGAPTASGFVLC